jgi:glycosyltransferase involved in cell wall biosynthesis
MLDLNKIARISITTNLSDGLPNSFLEAMIYGAFPIQSNTSNANEWIQVGVSGFLVPPNDPEIIEKAIRIALTDDNLVDNAALINHKLAKQKLDYKTIQNKAISIYTSALSEHKKQYK